jgi:pullulanase/glycogen debranching enzyme
VGARVEHPRPRGLRQWVLVRENFDFDLRSGFFDVISQDPVLSQVKLIAEPWDVEPGGYQVGAFPPPWSEWNGMYRDVVRDFWRGQSGVAEFAPGVTGSSDLYEASSRNPFASINFITAHDGFTLRASSATTRSTRRPTGRRTRTERTTTVHGTAGRRERARTLR